VTAQPLNPVGDIALLDAESGEAPWRRAARQLVKRRAAVIGLGVVVFFILLAVLAPLVSPYDPMATNWGAVRKAPSLLHPFGTDEIGRDVLARIIWGTRASLAAGLVSVSLALAAGVPIGLVSGYMGGFVDGLLMRMIDAMLAIPFLILAIALAAFLGPSLTNAMIAIGISQTPIFARLTRGQVLSVKHEEYIEAARAIGNPHYRIVLRHILPNIIPPLLVQATLAAAAAIIAEAAVVSGTWRAAARSFLGQHAQHCQKLHLTGAVDGGMAGRGDLYAGAVTQPVWRWAPRCARPAPKLSAPLRPSAESGTIPASTPCAARIRSTLQLRPLRSRGGCTPLRSW